MESRKSFFMEDFRLDFKKNEEFYRETKNEEKRHSRQSEYPYSLSKDDAPLMYLGGQICGCSGSPISCFFFLYNFQLSGHLEVSRLGAIKS